MDLELQMIEDFVGKDSFRKGMNYYRGYINYNYNDTIDGAQVYYFMFKIVLEWE